MARLDTTPTHPTTQPNHTVTTPTSELSKYIGRTGRTDVTKNAYKLTIPVTVVEVRTMINRVECQVTPTNGHGEAWVQVSSIIFDPETTP